MSHALWKLTFLAGVIGVGLLVVLQAQQGMRLPGMNQTDSPAPGAEGNTEQAIAAKNSGTSSDSPSADPPVSSKTDPLHEAIPPQPQSEPQTIAGNQKLARPHESPGIRQISGTRRGAISPVSATTHGNSPSRTAGAPTVEDLFSENATPSAGNRDPALRGGRRNRASVGTDDSILNPLAETPADHSLELAGAPREKGPQRPIRTATNDGGDPFSAEPRSAGSSKLPPEPTVDDPALEPQPAPIPPASAPPRSPAGEGTPKPDAESAASEMRSPPGSPPPTAGSSSSAKHRENPLVKSATSSDTQVRPVSPALKTPSLPEEGSPPSGLSEAVPVFPSGRTSPPHPEVRLPSVNDAPVVDQPPPATPQLPPATPVVPRNLSPGHSPETPALPPVTPVLPAQPAGNSSPATGTESPATVPARRAAPRPRLSIEKIAPPNAVLGRPMIYHIHVKNSGETAAYQVTVEDAVPKGVRLEGTIPQAELNEATLIFRLGALEAGSERRIAVKVTPLSEGEVGSVATVSFSAESDAQTVVTAPKLEFQLQGPAQATLGAPAQFTFHVANVGRADAHNVVIRNVLPASLRHADGDDLEYEMGVLPAGKSKEVSLALTTAQLGRAVNRAVVTADGGISVPAQAVLEIVNPALAVQHDGPRQLMLNRHGTFTNTASNSSTQPLKNITLVESLPNGFEFVSATSDGRYDAAKRTVTWMLDRLEPQQSRSVQLTVTAAGRGSQVSVVRAADGTGASGETFGTTHVSGVAAVSIDVTDLPSFLEVGQQAAFKIRIRNRGTDVADNVRTTLGLPAGTELVLINGGKYRREGNELVFDPITRLEPKHEAVLDVTLRGVQPQDSRVQVYAQSDAMKAPLRRDEALSIIAGQ